MNSFQRLGPAIFVIGALGALGASVVIGYKMGDKIGECLDNVKFEREMRKLVRDGKAIKLHGEYFTILEDGTLNT